LILDFSTQSLLFWKIQQGELSKPPDIPIYFIYLASKSQVLLESRNQPTISYGRSGCPAEAGLPDKL